MLLAIVSAIAYFYYNWQYFRLVSQTWRKPVLRIWFVLFSFIVNYLLFVAFSVWELPLMLNWFLFAFLLFFESLAYNKGDGRYALFSTLLGIIFGLTLNIFCRSVIAILINQPLQSFDNHTLNEANLKGIPVLLGFLLTGVVLQFLRRPSTESRIRLIIDYPQHQSFLLEMMAGMFFYLFLNLLLYSTPLNDIFLKVWSIKSCLFCNIGLYIAIRYTRRICELEKYREDNRQIEKELEQGQRETENLRKQALLDGLTGLYNRQYAEETVASMWNHKRDFVLCFMDLDGLKYVNDCYGHQEGDRYICTAAEQIRRTCRSGDLLFRYGGDEFLAIFSGTTAEAVEERMKIVNSRLQTMKIDNLSSYPLSFSYGAAACAGVSDWGELIQKADHKMYEQKQEKHSARES